MTNRARTVAALVVALGGCGSASQTYDAQGKDEQIVGEDAEPDPSLHSGRPSVPAPPQPVATLERADAAFTAGAPTERRASGSRALLPRLAWQDDVSDAAVVRRALVAARGKAAVGDGQVRSMVKERDVAIERRRYRSGDIHRHRGAACSGCPDGESHSGAARHTDRSPGGSTVTGCQLSVVG